MNRRIVNLAAVAVILGGVALLAQPARAAESECTEEQWSWAASIVNEMCPGGTFTLTCRGNAITSLVLVACAPGSG